jgi:hypothetical protein
MVKKLLRNPFLIFLPFVFYYAYIIVKSKWPKLYGDEIRYVDFASHLLHGFYSPPMPHINLWNGPGYPIILIPFVGWNIPDLYITLSNAVFLYLSVVFLYKAVALVANRKIALVLGLMLAIYPNALSMLPILYTEAFTGFLVSAFIFLVVKSYISGTKGYLIGAGLVLGYLVLTKIILGYVVVLCLVGCLGLMLVNKQRFYLRKAITLLAIAFAVCTPYLAYTWHLTGKFMYWGNSGGMSLYWMSTPYPHEYGDWKIPNLENKQYPTMFKSAEVVAILRKNHAKEINAILKHNELEQDELFKQAAIGNIKKNPMKFLENYKYNVARMLFNFPYSYSFQDGAILGNIVRGSMIVWATLIAMCLTFYNWRRVIFPVKILLFITSVYLLLSGVVSAYPRQLDVFIPVFLFWFGFLAANIKKLDLKFAGEEDLEMVGLMEEGIRSSPLKG